MTDLTRRKKELLNSYNNLCSCYGDIISEQTKTINQLKELLKDYKEQLSEIKDAYIDLTTQDEYGSYYIDEAKLFVEIVGKIIKDYDELELKQGEVLK